MNLQDLKKPLLVSALALLSACTSFDHSKTIVDIEVDKSLKLRDSYCDSYIGYDMCTMDLTDDGKSDLLYFDDTKEVFVYWKGVMPLIPENLSMHECVQPMEESMRKAASDLLYFPEDLGFVGRQRLKGALLLAYTKYVGYVNKCYKPDGDGEDQEDYGEFGEEDF